MAQVRTQAQTLAEPNDINHIQRVTLFETLILDGLSQCKTIHDIAQDLAMIGTAPHNLILHLGKRGDF